MFTARNDFITALYIIFLGIVPMMALISLGVWYVKNNPHRHWKKEAISTYVSSLDCFKKKRRPASSVVSPLRRRDNSKKFFERFMVVLTPRRDRSRDTAKVFTISDELPSKEKLHITKTNLVSTTNPEVINCSNNIEHRRSSLLMNAPRIDVARENESQDIVKFGNRETNANGKLSSPVKLEFGTKIKNFQKPTKNFHGLKLKTELQFEQLNESPCNTSGITPNETPGSATTSALLPGAGKTVSHIKTAPFYNKKPPPPPAPAQSLKPKF